MKIRLLLSASVAIAAMLSMADARAQSLEPPPGVGPIWYFGGEGGWTSLENTRVHFSNGAAAGTQKYRDGFNGGSRAGMEWGPWRFEEEFRYMHAQNAYNITRGGVSQPARGDRDNYAIMTNVLYDLQLGWPVTPHVGVGVGAVSLHDGIRVSGPGTLVNNQDWEFGYQGIAGIRYNLSPALAFDVDYRYLGTTSPRFRTAPFVAGFPVTTYRTSNDTHSIVASLSMRFGPLPAPVAAAPAPPAPAPERKVFLVFFDWDKDRITPAGMQIIQQAADAWKSGAPVQIQVTGYTDRSGSAGYNQRLSERRANNVAKALASVGVPPASMAVSGRGENDNRVPTADGVRDPQNRRVEIVS